MQLNADGGPHKGLHIVLQLARCGLGRLALRVHARACFHAHRQTVQRAFTGQHALVVRRQLGTFQNVLFDLRREHVDAAHDHHVVAAAGDFFHAPHGAGCARQQACEVARAVANDGQGLLGQAGEHQLAHLAIGHWLAGFGMDDLWVKMVFPNRRTVLGFDAFTGHARAHDFAQAINVNRRDARALFNRTAHVIGPRLGAKNANAQA